jgi:NAD(P)-dependent dehydrogenase (short-subunit alcohol dehydrogenase family)
VTRRDFPEDITGAALVTGAGQRIGSEIARFLASRGIPVALHVNRSREPAEAIAADIIDAGGKAVVMQADLTDRAAWQPLFDAAQEALGPITVLVNNASLFEPDDATDMTHESWARHLAVNLEAPVFLTRALANARSADRTGVVINMIDQRVWRLNPSFFSYTIAKAGLWTATQTLAQALAPTVRVAGIGPGPTIQNARQRPEDFQAQIDGLMLKRGAKPEDITRAVGFILDSPAFTGQMLAIDGGQHLAWETPDIAGIPE